MSSLLEVDSIRKSFGEWEILTDIYLQCETSEIIGLLGRNGSGKSTLLKIIFGTLQAENKFIRIDGKPLTKPYNKKGFISYLPQHHFIPKNLFLKEVVPIYSGDYTAFFEDRLLEKYIDYRIGDLSTGILRYFEIKLLLHANSKFILLDEPFNGIAPLLIQEVKDLIKKASINKGIILTDHSYKNVMDVATRCLLLYDGGLKNIQNTDELIRWDYLRL